MEMQPKALEEQLSQCECPFTWQMPGIKLSTVDQFLSSQLEKCNEIDDENEFKWTRFTLQLSLGYELWHHLRDIANATHFLNSCCDHLQKLTENSCLDPLFTSTHHALWHVALASRAHLQLADCQPELAKQTKADIPPVASLTKAERAGLLGIKAAVIRQYKPTGHRLSLSLATEASRLDPDQAEWHFIIANSLGRLRRMEHGAITKREIHEMQRAFSLKRDATYTVHLAQLFADNACYFYHNCHKPSVCANVQQGRVTSRRYARKAINRFREAIELRPHCPGLKVRVAHGLLRLPMASGVDVSLAKSLLDEALLHLPNSSMLHHDLGRYYEKFQKDPGQAMESLERAHRLNNYPAFTYLFNLRWKYGRWRECNLITEITDALAQYTSQAYQAELLVHLGASHLLLTDDWATAVQCFITSMKFDPLAKYMKEFHGFFWKGKSNLLVIVTNELRLRVKANKNSVPVFDIFLQQVVSTNQNLLQKPIDPRLFSEFKKLQLSTFYNPEEDEICELLQKHQM